jgi:uracil-DNA glycosylase
MMTEREELRRRLEFYRDLGIRELHVRAAPEGVEETVEPIVEAAQTPVEPEAPRLEPPLPSRPLRPPPPPARIASPPVVAAATPPPLLSMAPENDSLPSILEEIGDCTRCKLHKGRTKLVFGSGNPETKLVFVGEGPGADEDAQGLPFVGRAGQLLTQMIEGTSSKEGIPIKRPDVYICNVVKCRPPENRTPEPDEMQTCGQFLFRQLMVIQPRAICALGSTAAKALLGTKDGVTKLRGKWHKWNDIPLMVTYHPSYLLRAYNVAAKREAWEDLKKVLHYVYD